MTNKIQNGPGLLSLVSLGPGNFQQMTLAAKAALQSADVVIGYQVYIDFIRSLLQPHQELVLSPIGSEVERAKQSLELAATGQHVAMISSGDIGIYAMASPIFELLQQQPEPKPEVQVYPGVSAIQATAAKLGAPLGHDFCTISLSDLLTPWSVIERRLQAAAWGDFVIGFYNPRSKKRDWQLQRALEILLAYRSEDTPVAMVRNITRHDEEVTLTTLTEFEPEQVDMFTLVLVGNSQTFATTDRMITPRGYVREHASQAETDVTEIEFTKTLPTPPQMGGGVYPITLTHMHRNLVVVVGGGPVGQRKVKGLLNTGAKIVLISPKITPQLQQWVNEGAIKWLPRLYQKGDMAGYQLAFAATNQRQINAQITDEAALLDIPCNVADNPDTGHFHVPAVHRQPELVVSVSTTGKSPRKAKQIRDKIAEWLEKDN